MQQIVKWGSLRSFDNITSSDKNNHFRNVLHITFYAISPQNSLFSITLFFIISGVVLVMGGGALFSSITFDSLAGRIIRLTTGSILITFGLMQLGKFPNPLTAVTRITSPLMRFQARHRSENRILGMIVFGFAYPMAGFG